MKSVSEWRLCRIGGRGCTKTNRMKYWLHVTHGVQLAAAKHACVLLHTNNTHIGIILKDTYITHTHTHTHTGIYTQTYIHIHTHIYSICTYTCYIYWVGKLGFVLLVSCIDNTSRKCQDSISISFWDLSD